MLGIKERTSDMQFKSQSLKTRLLELSMDNGEKLKSRINTAILTRGLRPTRNHHWFARIIS